MSSLVQIVRGLVILLLGLCTSHISCANVKYDPSQLKQFEQTGQCPSCDLTRADLSYTNKDNVNLMHALLTEALLYSANFSGGDFKSANLLSARLDGSNFTKSDFSGAYLVDANMNHSDFSSCKFDGASISGVSIAHSVLIASNITPAQLATTKSLSCTVMPDGTRHAPDKGDSC